MKKEQLVKIIKEIITNEMLNKGSGYKDKDLRKYREDLMNKNDVDAILKDYLTKENLPQSLANISILRWVVGKDARIDGVLVDDIIHRGL
jgi:hypothetical protein